MKKRWKKYSVQGRDAVAEQLFSTGEFARRANVTVRTIHYYEKKGLIQPEKISENGYRYYGKQEFARLQRILTLKLLGFSLEEIQEFSLNILRQWKNPSRTCLKCLGRMTFRSGMKSQN